MIRRDRKLQDIPAPVLTDIACALRVLAHPVRLRIVELLERDQLTVGELADALGIAANACSQHLNLMRAHGLLSAERDGKSVYYRVAHPAAHNILQCIREHVI